MIYALILYALAFGQVLLLYGIAAPQAIRLGEQAFLNRNPAWVSDHGAPSTARPLRRLFLFISAGAGLAQLIGLFVLAIPPLSWSSPAEMLVIPMPVLAVLLGVYMWRGYRDIYMRIPASATRTTQLKPRRAWDFVNGWALAIAALLVVAFALRYVGAFREALLSANLLAVRGGVFALAVGVVLAAMINVVRRRETFVAAQGGNRARRLEAGLYVVVLYALIAASQYLLMADIANMPFPPTVVLLIVGVVVMQLYALYACLWAGRSETDRRFGALLVRSIMIYAVGAALSFGLARAALEPVYASNARLAASVPGNLLNAPNVRTWNFAATAGRPELKRELRRDARLPGGEYWHIEVPYRGHERWDTRVWVAHLKPVKRGDVIEAQVWLRSDAPGGAEINGLTQSTRWGWSPIGKATWRVGGVWTIYRVRGVAPQDYGIGESDFELHLASGKYGFDLGPARVFDLGPEATARGEGQ